MKSRYFIFQGNRLIFSNDQHGKISSFLSRNKLYIKLLLLVLMGNYIANAQGQYHLDIGKGLPSNKIYYMLEDRNGYMWMATPKGVVQFNGYTPKLYGLEAGLSNDDVWALYEDHKGRIWTPSISNELGYIRNNRYKKVVLASNNNTLYPKDIRQYPGGILFYSPYVTRAGALCIEKNDTIRIFDMKNLSFGFLLLGDEGDITVLYRNTVYKIHLDAGMRINIRKVCTPGEQVTKLQLLVAFEHYCLSYTINGSMVNAFNTENCAVKTVNIDSISGGHERIKLILDQKKGQNYFSVVTDEHIYRINAQLECEKVIPVKELVNDEEIGGNKITAVISDKLWGTCVGTSDKGAYFNLYDNGKPERLPDLYLPDHRHIGTAGDMRSYWWNELKGSIVCIDSNYHIRQLPGSFENSVKLIPYNEDTSFLLANREINVLNNKTGVLSTAYSGYNNLDDYSSPVNIAAKTVNDLYILSRRLGLVRWQKKKNVTVSELDPDRYSGIFYDKHSGTTWVYNSKKILLLRGRAKITVPKDVLEQAGITKIEQIDADAFGNIFLKDDSKLFMFNYNNPGVKVLFRNYRMEDALMKRLDNKLIVAGSFGNLVSLVKGPMQVSQPVVSHNVKSTYYKYIYDMVVFKRKLLLNTDRGFYTSMLPRDSAIDRPAADGFAGNYRFLVTYNDSLYHIRPGDTIITNQNSSSLFVDLINPMGTGTPRYMYRFNAKGGNFQTLNADELHFPNLAPGEYHSLSLIAFDDVWRGDPIDVYLYVSPRWWEKSVWQRVFLAAGVCLLVILIVSVAYITRQIVGAQNTRRNLRLKLELNSIYSQINPHFVFNSLTTALFFIKRLQLDEAQQHIGKFSKLLRAYIKFSRKRYITIADEVENLRNYIELQQARFEDKFDYEILVSDAIDQTTVSIPALLLQPIVENAITHGLLHLERRGHLSIRFTHADNKGAVMCVIEDDGIGRDKARQLAAASVIKTESYGDILIGDLVAIFNKYEKMRIRIKYTDKQIPETGTIVTIVINNPHLGHAI